MSDRATIDAGASAPIPILSVTGVSKTFVGRRVLSDFTLEIQPGEIRALLGQNGSGKSTFIKILAGYQPPDRGAHVTVRGVTLELPLRPSEPRQLGLTFVHQHLGLIPTESVLENFLLGDMRSRFGWRIPWRAERARVRDALATFGIDLPLDATVGSLPEVQQAVLAIIRAVEQLRDHHSGLLVLDEPTAYLPRDGIDRLFGVVREIAASGFGVLFVTHRLDEVTALASHVSVLRDGVRVADEPVAGLDEAALSERILGFALDGLYPDHGGAPRPERVFSATGVSGTSARDITLDIGRGEIVGVTGLLGMGWEELPYLFFGTGEGTGQVAIGATSTGLETLTPGRAMREGMALLPADRLGAAGVGEASLLENLTLPTLPSFVRRGLIQRRREARETQGVLDEYGVRPAEPDRKLATLSGGNQQKVLLAKWFRTAPRLLLLHEPTHGIDVGAKKQIFARIRSAADDGTAVLIASAEYEDIAHLCDRVLVLRNGRIVGELAGPALTTERILDRCFDGHGSTSGRSRTHDLEVTNG